MELSELVIEIIHHLKKGPFAEVVSARGKDFASGPVPIVANEDWFRKELIKFKGQTEMLLDELKSAVEVCEDYILIQEQQMKLTDALLQLQRNKLLSDDSIQMRGKLKEGEVEEYNGRIDNIQLFIAIIEKKLKTIESAGLSPKDHVEFDVEKEGLTKSFKMGSLEISKTGADIAFMMQVFRKAGWFKNYEHDVLDKVFAEFLEQNVKSLKDKEYYFLKNFMTTLSHIKSYKYDGINEGKKEQFQTVLKSVMVEAQHTFLDDIDTWEIHKN